MLCKVCRQQTAKRICANCISKPYFLISSIDIKRLYNININDYQNFMRNINGIYMTDKINGYVLYYWQRDFDRHFNKHIKEKYFSNLSIDTFNKQYKEQVMYFLKTDEDKQRLHCIIKSILSKTLDKDQSYDELYTYDIDTKINTYISTHLMDDLGFCMEIANIILQNKKTQQDYKDYYEDCTTKLHNYVEEKYINGITSNALYSKCIQLRIPFEEILEKVFVIVDALKRKEEVIEYINKLGETNVNIINRHRDVVSYINYGTGNKEDIFYSIGYRIKWDACYKYLVQKSGGKLLRFLNMVPPQQIINQTPQEIYNYINDTYVKKPKPKPRKKKV